MHPRKEASKTNPIVEKKGEAFAKIDGISSVEASFAEEIRIAARLSKLELCYRRRSAPAIRLLWSSAKVKREGQKTCRSAACSHVASFDAPSFRKRMSADVDM